MERLLPVISMIDGEGVSLTSNAQKSEELNQSKISGARRVRAPMKETIRPALQGPTAPSRGVSICRLEVDSYFRHSGGRRNPGGSGSWTETESGCRRSPA